MTTKSAGAKITGLLALTFESEVALNVKDPVHVTANYTVAKADGTKPVIGIVSVANKGRGADGAYPVPKVPGDITAEVPGFSVLRLVSGGAIPAGVEVGIGAAGTLVVAGAGVRTIGVSLTSTAGAGADIDVLHTQP